MEEKGATKDIWKDKVKEIFRGKLGIEKSMNVDRSLGWQLHVQS